jgi:hypothetical protein
MSLPMLSCSPGNKNKDKGYFLRSLSRHSADTGAAIPGRFGAIVVQELPAGETRSRTLVIER